MKRIAMLSCLYCLGSLGSSCLPIPLRTRVRVLGLERELKQQPKEYMEPFRALLPFREGEKYKYARDFLYVYEMLMPRP